MSLSRKDIELKQMNEDWNSICGWLFEDKRISEMLRSLERREPQTALHSLRVASMVYRMLLQLPCDIKKVMDLVAAAALHDTGKLCIPKDILCKRGTLSEVERRIIECHAERGAIQLETMGFSEEIVQGVRWHHERWDGTGYPNALCKWQIPLSARVIALCDSVDAMRCQRIYRKNGMSDTQCQAELLRSRGSQFDPQLVRVFLQSWGTIVGDL